MTTSTITVRTDAEISEKIAELAKAMDRSRNWVVEEALKQYIAGQAWQIEGIQAAQDSLAQGESLPFEEVMAEMEALIEEKAREPEQRNR